MPPSSAGLRPTFASRSAAAAKSHACLVKSGPAIDTYAWNNVLTRYAKCSSGGIEDACKLFEDIPQRDTVSWNSLIAAHVSSGAYRQSWDLFRTMMLKGLAFDQYTFGSILKSVAGAKKISHGRQLHSVILKSGFYNNVFAASALVDMYGKCRLPDEAYAVFKFIVDPNIVSWNAMIAGFAQVSNVQTAFLIFSRMERAAVEPDEATFASLLTVLDRVDYYRLLCQLHAKITKHRQRIDLIVYNASITAYSQCGSISDSRKIFDELEGMRDLVTWNSMLAAYACSSLIEYMVELFIKMQELGVDQDMYTFTSAISACFEDGQDGNGRALHGLVIKKGLNDEIPVFNSLIAMYFRSNKLNMVEDAFECFASMESKDNISWNSMLTGLSQVGLSEEALKLFAYMQSIHIDMDHYAFSATLQSCSDTAALQLGRAVHGLILKSGFTSNDFVASSLIYMYSKCGIVDDARRSFDESSKDSSVTWNSMIFGYGQHGKGQIALDLFSKMQELQVAPDHITFVGVITACSHTGLVEEGSVFLNTMEHVYGIPLRMEHYACGVDLYGRAGRLEEAKKLIDSMPFEPDAMVWMTLLGACRVHGNMELASHVSTHLLLFEPKEHCTYILLSHLLSGFGLWSDRAVVQKAMRSRGLSKVPGCSWIEIKNKIHSFNAEERSHPEVEEIYEMLAMLTEEAQMSPYDDAEFQGSESG